MIQRRFNVGVLEESLHALGFAPRDDRSSKNGPHRAEHDRERRFLKVATRLPPRYWVWRTVDALDYTVEHLSMYERMIHSQKTGADKASPIGDAVYGAFVDRLAAYERRLKDRCGGDDAAALKSQVRDTDAKRTVGVMPLYAAGHADATGEESKDSLHGAGSGHTRYESKALYLNITIRSLRCHFGAVAVSALHPGDRAYLLRGKNLPVIDDVLWVDPDHLPVNKPSFLGIATIRAIQRRWTNESTPLWDDLDYVHYTEADQVLHVRERHLAKLYAPLKDRVGSSGRQERAKVANFKALLPPSLSTRFA